MRKLGRDTIRKFDWIVEISGSGEGEGSDAP